MQVSTCSIQPFPNVNPNIDVRSILHPSVKKMIDDGNTSIVRNVHDKIPRFAEGEFRQM